MGELGPAESDFQRGGGEVWGREVVVGGLGLLVVVVVLVGAKGVRVSERGMRGKEAVEKT